MAISPRLRSAKRCLLHSFTIALTIRITSGLCLKKSNPKEIYEGNTLSLMRRRRLLESTISCTAFLWTVPQSSTALSPKEAANQYDTYAASYDQLDGGEASSLLGIDQARTLLLQKAKGRVLEIGAGTGLNLDKYVKGQVTSLTLVDISSGMLQQANARIQSLPNLRDVPVSFVKADATSELTTLFDKDSFDTVVDSFSLCVMGNEGAKKCLDQMSQVVKPNDGRVLLLENSRSSNPLLGLYQDATADAAASVGGKGCVYNQDVRAMIRATGRLEITKEIPYAAGVFRAFECIRTSHDR